MNQVTVQFDTTQEERIQIALIAERAKDLNPEITLLSMRMDITACHCNGCPLDLNKLLYAPAFDFIHDIVGIWKNLDRSTGEIRNHFLPRSSL